jgi:hypothetical protein
VLSAKEDLRITLSEDQWDRIDESLSAVTTALRESNSDPVLHASVRRSALVAARVASILTVLRQFETGELANRSSLQASDADVRSGLAIAMTSLCHAIELAKTLKFSADAHLDGAELSVYAALPDHPLGLGSKEIAERSGLHIRKVQRMLRRLNNRGLLHEYTSKGPYSRRMSPLSHVVSVASDASSQEAIEESDKTTETTNATCDKRNSRTAAHINIQPNPDELK